MSDTVESLQTALDKVVSDYPTIEVGEVSMLMVQQLDVALHGSTWARDASPRTIWLDLLNEVQARS